MVRVTSPAAIAQITGSEEYPKLGGTVRFCPVPEGLLIEADIHDLPETETGFFAFHIHEGGDCHGQGFPNTGMHYNPEKKPHPLHAGDLPPLLSCGGRAYSQVLTGRVRLEEIMGRAVVIHGGPDDFTSQPAGNAGKKIACGIISPV